MNESGRKRRYLDFETPLIELDEQIEKLRHLGQTMDMSKEIKSLELRSKDLLKQIVSGLNDYQIVQLARHPERPTSMDYVNSVFDRFIPLSGDREFSDDKSIIGGLALLDNQPVMVIGQQKGRSTAENQLRNFGMPKPEGYRKALRWMKLAEQWKIPLITFIDTPGAFPGIEAEERGQAQAIALNIQEMTDLQIPIISVIVGEGGSGGALALAVCDQLLMFQYSIYSVISPEGCAAITWKDSLAASKAAEALRLTAPKILELGIAHEIIEEPLGGAHRDSYQASQSLKTVLTNKLCKLVKLPTEQLLIKRYQLFRKLGQFQGRSNDKKRAGG